MYTWWNLLAAALGAGLLAGVLFWVSARVCVAVIDLLPTRLAFADDLLAVPGDRARLEFRAVGREIGLLLAALLVAALAVVAAVFLLPALAQPGLPLWVWIIALLVEVAALGGVGWIMFQLVRRRRQLAFEWAAQSAVGNILKRLNLSGNAVFHGVNTETSVIDHVVVGRRGVFALNVVARVVPVTTEGEPAAELRNGKLWMAGNVEARPVGEAARNMTLLSGALTRVVGHRVPVRSVLVVPGWHTIPNGNGNHLVLNESNLAMLTSWNTPDAHLMDEDCVVVQSFLQQASRVTRLA